MKDDELTVVDLRSNQKATKVADIDNETMWCPEVTIRNTDGSWLRENKRYNKDSYTPVDDDTFDMIDLDD